jgi:FkbM family methyltransferase
MALIDFHGVRLDMAHLGTGFWAAWEPEETALVLNMIEPGDRVLVAGGGFGWLAALCAALVGINNVTVFEPNPALAVYLNRNITQDGYPLRVFKAALSDKTGEALLWEHPWWAASSLTRRPAEHRGPLRVQARDANDVIERERVNVLVLDIEGSEWDVTRALDWTPIRAAVIELHDAYLREAGHDPDDVLRAMTEGGLTVVDTRANAAGTHRYIAGVRA